MVRRLLIATFVPLFCLGFSAVARAQIAPAAEMPAPTETTAPAETEAPAQGLGPVAALPVAANPANPPQWGGAFRGRWVTMPHWMLGLFTKHNQALSSYAMAVEGFRRKRDPENPNRFTEISLAIGYQNMSPPDGNWLGKSNYASIDTDWVQAKNLGLWSIEIGYTARQYFNEVVGIHYGAGLGLGIVQGKILRTSSSPKCTDKNLNSPDCRPVVCTSTSSGCSEADLVKSTTNNPYPDTAETPKRFKESSVPGAIPVVNLTFGLDFRIPQAKGLEFRLEAGLFDIVVLFMGGGIAYVY